MRKVTAQFEFELRTELARLGGGTQGGPHEPIPGLQAGLTLATGYYQHALNCNLTAHTRAMLVRQLGAVRKAGNDFAAMSEAA